jgi:hypothetical protein
VRRVNEAYADTRASYFASRGKIGPSTARNKTIGRREWQETRFHRSSRAGDHYRKLATWHEHHAARLRPAASIPARAAVQYPVITFVTRRYQAQCYCSRCHGDQRGRIDLQSKKEKENRCKEVSQWSKQATRSLGNGTGNSDTDEKGANGGGHLQLLS